MAEWKSDADASQKAFNLFMEVRMGLQNFCRATVEVLTHFDLAAQSQRPLARKQSANMVA